MDDVWERIEATVELLRATGADGRVPSSFYTDMATALMRHARRAGLQSADAEDVAAELLQKIILKLHQFEHRGRGMGIWTTCLFFGQFSSPWLVARLEHVTGTVQGAFVVAGLAGIVVAGLAFYSNLVRRHAPRPAPSA